MLVNTAPPEQTFDFEALVQAVLLAPGYKGAKVAAMPADTEIPLMVCGAVAVHAQLAGHVAVPGSLSTPVLLTVNATPGTSIDQFKSRFGCTKPPAQFERATLKVATHPFAKLGAVTKLTTTPLCGLVTTKLKPEIALTPPAIFVAIEIVLCTFAVPEQTLSCEATTQLDAADGYKGACVAANAPVTEMPLTVNGALLSQLHVAGQFTEPEPAQDPLS